MKQSSPTRRDIADGKRDRTARAVSFLLEVGYDSDPRVAGFLGERRSDARARLALAFALGLDAAMVAGVPSRLPAVAQVKTPGAAAVRKWRKDIAAARRAEPGLDAVIRPLIAAARGAALAPLNEAAGPALAKAIARIRKG